MSLWIPDCSGGAGSDLRSTPGLPDSCRGRLMFAGDVTANPPAFEYSNKIRYLDISVGGLGLSDGEREPAALSDEPCPGLPAEELAGLRLDPANYVTHFKPRGAEIIIAQIAARIPQRRVRMLEQKQLFEF